MIFSRLWRNLRQEGAKLSWLRPKPLPKHTSYPLPSRASRRSLQRRRRRKPSQSSTQSSTQTLPTPRPRRQLKTPRSHPPTRPRRRPPPTSPPPPRPPPAHCRRRAAFSAFFIGGAFSGNAGSIAPHYRIHRRVYRIHRTLDTPFLNQNSLSQIAILISFISGFFAHGVRCAFSVTCVVAVC